MRALLTLRFLEPHAEYGPVFVRLVIGFYLWYGTQDNVLSWERMVEFRDFLARFGFPFPMISAHVSAYAQFLCGILYIVGLLTRPAAAVMIINFIIALVVVHRSDSFQGAALALIMLFTSLFLLLHGPGRLSVDHWWSRRSAARNAQHPSM